MKCLIILLAIFSLANAQGTEFLVDNIVKPMIDDLGTNMGNFILGGLNSLAGQLGGKYLFGFVVVIYHLN